MERGSILKKIVLPFNFLLSHFLKCHTHKSQDPRILAWHTGPPCSARNIPFYPRVPLHPSTCTATGLIRLVTFPKNSLNSSFSRTAHCVPWAYFLPLICGNPLGCSGSVQKSSAELFQTLQKTLCVLVLCTLFFLLYIFKQVSSEVMSSSRAQGMPNCLHLLGPCTVPS